MNLANQNDMQLLNFISNNNLEGAESLLFFPKYVQIETVALCNANCVMCTVKKWERAHYVMKDNLFDKIIDELSAYCDWVRKVTIQLDGEPLLDEKLEERIRALKNTGIKCVAFSTNASLMTRERARSVILSGVDEVSFSIDGFTAATFESIRRGLKFEQCRENVNRFIELRNMLNRNLAVRLRMTIQKANAEDYAEYVKYWEQRLEPTDSVYGKLISNWGNSFKNYSLSGLQCDNNFNRSLCISPWSSFVILCDGRVPLCCEDFNASMLMGNVCRDRIQDIWQGPKFAKIRNLHEQKGRASMAICHNCNTWAPSTKIAPFEPIAAADFKA